MDQHPWALDEARATYHAFGLKASLVRAGAADFRFTGGPGLVTAAYVVNELTASDRDRLLASLLAQARAGACVLIVEPLARAAAPWWPDWARGFAEVAGRADEWKLAIEPPALWW